MPEQLILFTVTKLFEYGPMGIVMLLFIGIIAWLIRTNQRLVERSEKDLAVINEMHERRSDAITKNAQVMFGAEAAQIKAAEAINLMSAQIATLIAEVRALRRK